MFSFTQLSGEELDNTHTTYAQKQIRNPLSHVSHVVFQPGPCNEFLRRSNNGNVRKIKCFLNFPLT